MTAITYSLPLHLIRMVEIEMAKVLIRSQQEVVIVAIEIDALIPSSLAEIRISIDTNLGMRLVASHLYTLSRWQDAIVNTSTAVIGSFLIDTDSLVHLVSIIQIDANGKATEVGWAAPPWP